MNLHEYQAKALLKNFGVSVPAGLMAETAELAKHAAIDVRAMSGCNSWAVKAQIHAGGRGKGGGVKIAQSVEEVAALADKMIGMQLITHQTGSEGKTVHRILVEQGIFYPGKSEVKEYYISILLNRATSRNIILYSTEGGMDIEAVAENTPHLLFKEEIDPLIGVKPHIARRVAYNLGLEGNAFHEMIKLLPALYNAYISLDAVMIEINPLFKTSDDKLLAADAKIRIDDNALYRHPDLAMMRDETEEDATEIEAGKSNLNFVKLDGNVGCMVNGAGLAMATMDIIKHSGGMPANFLDVGGKANAQTVEAGFRILLHDPTVKAILINIFGGIVRCDRVAQGVVDAYRNIGAVNIPVIVRLQGTNAIEAKELIDNSGLKVQSAITLAEAAEKVKKVFETN